MISQEKKKKEIDEYKYSSASAGERKALEIEWCLVVGNTKSASKKFGI